MKSAVFTVRTIPAPRARSFGDFLALAIATCGGTGRLPLFPASWGSLFGVGVYFCARTAGDALAVWAEKRNFSGVPLESVRVSFALILLIFLFLTGIWSATRVERMTGEKDPRMVVIDEVVGQFITFLFVPAGMGLWTLPAGFLAFRLFDIWKPFPADRLETLPGGLGAMADDVMAGFYAAALMSLLCSFSLAFL